MTWLLTVLWILLLVSLTLNATYFRHNKVLIQYVVNKRHEEWLSYTSNTGVEVVPTKPCKKCGGTGCAK